VSLFLSRKIKKKTDKTEFFHVGSNQRFQSIPFSGKLAKPILTITPVDSSTDFLTTSILLFMSTTMVTNIKRTALTLETPLLLIAMLIMKQLEAA